jgi:4-aminobutyrate aminotransferase-like enzyme
MPGRCVINALKQQAISDFSEHVSSAKARFWQQYEMDVVMGRREGPYFWDLDGNRRFWNLHCNGGVYNLGHRNPEIIRELNRAMQDLDMENGHLISSARADLGRRLAELMPGDLNYTVFGVSGGEAIDLSIKVARAYTGRVGIISAREVITGIPVWPWRPATLNTGTHSVRHAPVSGRPGFPKAL